MIGPSTTESLLDRIIAGWKALQVSTRPVDRAECEDAFREIQRVAGTPYSDLELVVAPSPVAVFRSRLDDLVQDDRLPMSGWNPIDVGAQLSRTKISTWGKLAPELWTHPIVSAMSAISFYLSEIIGASFADAWKHVGLFSTVGTQSTVKDGLVSSVIFSAHCAGIEFDALGLGETNPVTWSFVEMLRFCHGFALSDRKFYACDRPEVVRLDALGRAHCRTGPAFRYRDGFEVYFFEGVRLPKRFILDPGSIQIEDIAAERNAEKRRAIMELYGRERFVKSSQTKILQSDDYGSLLSVEPRGMRRMTFVHVKNAAPDPDGSIHEFYLRVPERMRTAHEAVAWTFRQTPETYHLLKET